MKNVHVALLKIKRPIFRIRALSVYNEFYIASLSPYVQSSR